MKSTMIALSCIALFCLSFAGCNEATKPNKIDVTAKKPVPEDTQSLPKDNTGNNARDADRGTTTPMEQKHDKTDLQITADVRQRITDSKMSTDAQNVKVISRDGIVTLRGPVKSSEEKEQIGKIAKEFAGTNHVKNELEVESQK
jgi:osmotically-inducible protein OsmY